MRKKINPTGIYFVLEAFQGLFTIRKVVGAAILAGSVTGKILEEV